MTTPYIARGLDHQGRHHEAAHAATDIGAPLLDDGLNAARGIVWALVMSLLAWLVVALAALAIWWPA
jgi:hypothetical protein